ncbi:MAG: bifunctional ornithine acetyltransferase/N-acetylglutamate synthase, partial [Dehalococcoidia bacterium]|nr:bifunctional ornithine acetyltransferase/N-acetylglutamate synthase [Dehalococcoidia bacterium]
METLPDGSVTSPRGFRADGVAAGIKESGALDLAALVSDTPAVAAATFSRNRAAAASVISNRQRIRRQIGRGVIVNSGNANCATGAQGMADNEELAHLLARQIGVPDDEIFACSTGVIGVPLPMDNVRRGAAAL